MNIKSMLWYFCFPAAIVTGICLGAVAAATGDSGTLFCRQRKQDTGNHIQSPLFYQLLSFYYNIPIQLFFSISKKIYSQDKQTI